METMVDVFQQTVKKTPHNPSFMMRVGKEFEGPTYEALQILVENVAAGLLTLGIQKQDKIALICDSSLQWITSDLAILHTGGITVPRGLDTTPMEISFIIEHSQSQGALIQDWQTLKLIEERPDIINQLNFVIVLQGSFSSKYNHVYSLDKLSQLGRKAPEQTIRELQDRINNLKGSDIASITYTSGVTGTPKGVLTSHANFVHQIKDIPNTFEVNPQDRFISLLPAWHIFGHVVDHYMPLSRGAPIYYTNKKDLSQDLILVKPTIIISVPRVWEGIYNRIVSYVHQLPFWRRWIFWSGIRLTELYQKPYHILHNQDLLFQKPNPVKRLLQKILSLFSVIILYPFKRLLQLQFKPIRNSIGGKVRLAISGGSSLPKHLDSFFNALNIPICEGYGLTETTSVVTHRYCKNHTTKKSMMIPETVGPPTPEANIKIIDSKGNDITNTGEAGLVYVKGPMVMQGYWQNEKETGSVLDDDGWFNTGDLGRMTIWGALKIVGREKDTIVLSSGENIDPLPLEETLSKNIFIESVIIVGQDRKGLGALIVPIADNIKSWAMENLDSDLDLENNYDKILKHPKVHRHYQKILDQSLSYQNGFKEYEKIHYFCLLPDTFTIGEELTPSFKLKRRFIHKKYSRNIDNMYNLK